MSIFDRFKTKSMPSQIAKPEMATGEVEDYFKAFIPEYLYKPPYGFPRRVNLPMIKMLSSNAYVFSVIKTLCDEASNVEWDIRVKEEVKKKNPDVDYSEKINEVKRFFDAPNKNGESFNHLLRSLITGVLEVDSGVWVKVYNKEGKLSQLFCRDGATFLKNPNIYGYIGDRKDYIKPIPIDVTSTEGVRNFYDNIYRNDAAYFQYGWTAGAMPVPFGKREIMYVMANPRPDSIYGKSPVETLADVIMALVYGSKYNLAFYTNNNMPEGVIQLLGAQQPQIQAFREKFEAQFKETDEFGNKRKSFFKFPVVSNEVKFTPFQVLSKDLEIISQQEWFVKVLWMCFGVTADEMGFTENSNKAVAGEQAKLVKRKALGPILKNIQYHINSQIIPEFFDADGLNDKDTFDFGDCPIEFVFNYYDIDEDKKKHDLLEQELRMGIKTPLMVAAELGIDTNELKESITQSTMLNGGVKDANGNPISDEVKKDFSEKEAGQKTSNLQTVPEKIKTDTELQKLADKRGEATEEPSAASQDKKYENKSEVEDGKITFTKKEIVAEHEKLVKVLEKKDPKELDDELEEQKKELDKYKEMKSAKRGRVHKKSLEEDIDHSLDNLEKTFLRELNKRD